MAWSEGVGADHQADATERSVGDGETIAERIEIMSNGEFIDFSMMKDHFAGGVDEDGGVEDFFFATFDHAGADVGAGVAGESGELAAGAASWNFVGESDGGRVHPSERKSLGQ